MKIKSILVSLLAVIILAGCSKENETYDGTEESNVEVAYLSIKIESQPNTRASSEDAGANESDLKTLYLITFDDGGNIVGVPETSYFFTKITSATNNPDAIKVSAAATKLLVVANPGTKLENVLTNVNATTTFPTVNAAINTVNMTEITDDVANITKGFTMINSGDETGKNAGDKITDPLINISAKIKKVSDAADENAAKAAAALDRAVIKVERLASKVEFKLKGSIDVKPTGASFTFGNWTLDAVNSTFYPYAEKTLLEVTHSTGGSYAKNFYTQDPNFSSNSGIVYTTVNPVSFVPTLATPYTWMNAAAKTYCVENTMSAAEQLFERATRIVVKGTYYPAGHSQSGDWFNFAGVNYMNLDELKAAYDAAGSASNLQTACDNMFARINAYATVHSLSLTGTDFKSLTVADLTKIQNGGDVIKNGKNDVIRWYQNGLTYYYYEIRHNNETNKEMDFAKYGVVRNNWYSLTLGSVNGAGTPWYPSIENPGPGDPDSKDPIDESAGYLGITVNIAPWIIWETEIGF